MNLTHRVRFLLSAIAAVIVLAGPCQAFAEENTRTRDVVYGHKFGMALTLDVLKPAKPNGAGVIFMVSGGFNSDIAAVDAGFFGPAGVQALPATAGTRCSWSATAPSPNSPSARSWRTFIVRCGSSGSMRRTTASTPIASALWASVPAGFSP